MQPQSILKKFYVYIENFQSKNKLSRCFILLFIFLLAVVSISYYLPFLEFGRFFGTDDYSHVLFTQRMNSYDNNYDFYTRMAEMASDPDNPENAYNYPFGLWFFGSLVSKITGLTVFTGNFIVVLLFFAAIIGIFYFYSGIFLPQKEQKIIAALFLMSMPNVAMILLNYRPSVFILPFLFMILYIAFQETINWKHLLVLLISLFIVAISHTGTFIFLIGFCLVFFLLYCLIWGKFSKSIYITIISIFLIYFVTLNWFPQISNQYEVKTTLFLKPGNFLADKFNFFLVQDLTKIFYENFLVGQQLVYAILFVVALYGASRVLIYIHKNVTSFISRRGQFPAFILPIQNISHSVLASPILLGPVHVILSVAGVFRLDDKGKCIFITLIFTTFLPDLLYASEGLNVATGALREISYLIVIIPITATLGLWWVLSKIHNLKTPYKTHFTFIVWFIVLCSMILAPTLGNTYYSPKIAGEDYIINGMTWLSENGDLNEKVTGFGYRSVPVFTRMDGPSVEDGTETRLFVQLLQNIHLSSTNQEKNVQDFRQLFGVKYIISSDKVVANLRGTPANVKIDSNRGLNKMYSSKDFGIYEVITSSGDTIPEYTITENTTIKKFGSAYEIKSDYYKVVLNENNPTLDSLGTKQKNYFGPGYLLETIKIDTPVNLYSFPLNKVNFSSEINNNQILYKTILNTNETAYSSLSVRYTFFPKVIKREYILSNDWHVSNTSSRINARFLSTLYSPLSNYIITNNKESQKRRIFESEDAVEKAIKVEDIFIFNINNQENAQKQGIHIKNVPTSPFPLDVSYKGSTKYDLSAVQIAQLNSMTAGESLHITQYISTGDEYGTEIKILSQNGIQLNNYPDGIKPLIIIGTGSSFSDDGYAILKNYNIPYSQVIRPVSPSENSNKIDNTSETQNSSAQNSSAQNLQTINLKELSNMNVNFISSEKMTSINYDNITTQLKTIESGEEYAKSQGITMNGFMPLSFRYNLDTIKVLADKKISFLVSNMVNPPYYEGYRNPQLAYYHGEPTDIVIIPVSYPISSSLYTTTETDEIFTSWRNIIKGVADNDEMIVFLFDPADIADPEYSSRFRDLFSFAQNNSFTFTSPDIIADHYRDLQKIHFSGFTDSDMASIQVTNDNDKIVQKVTFKVILEELPSGNYIVDKGKIVKIEKQDGYVIAYISLDIPAYSTLNLTIKPDSDKKILRVQFPKYMSEGPVKITVNDQEGKPLKDVDVTINSNIYRTSKEGNVTVNFHRGNYTIIIGKPGYEKFVNVVEVKGKLANLETFF